jgi:hypothetical protein
MSNSALLSKRDVAKRWGTSIKTIDRLRQSGRLAWVDVAAGRGNRPLVRFRFEDIVAFEARFRQECAA